MENTYLKKDHCNGANEGLMMRLRPCWNQKEANSSSFNVVVGDSGVAWRASNN